MPNRIFQVLDVSTCHLPQEVCEDLNGFDGVIAHQHENGWWLWVPEDPVRHAEGYEDPIPQSVIDLLVYARKHGCDWVLIDGDGFVEDDLPSWDW